MKNTIKKTVCAILAAILITTFAYAPAQAATYYNRWSLKALWDRLYTQSSPTTPPATSTPTPTPSAPQASQKPQSGTNELVSLINNERTQRGIKALTADPALTRVAQAKAEDMVKNGYFSHTSPTYGSPAQMIRSYGISFRYSGENIAKNSSIQRAHTALMNSSGHRKNTLNANYTKVGIGVAQLGNGSYVIVEMFVG